MGQILSEEFFNFTSAPWVVSGNVPLVPARTGTGAKLLGNAGVSNAKYTIPVGSRTDAITVGCAWKSSPDTLTGSRQIWALYGGSTETLIMSRTETGQFMFNRTSGGASIFTPPSLTMPDRWYFLEVAIKCHDTAGTITIWLDGVQVYAGTGLDTKPGSSAIWTDFMLKEPSTNMTSEHIFDDLYIANDLDRLGDPLRNKGTPDARPKRSAWLTWSDGTGRLDLDDLVAGYMCEELDLGWPEVRTVVTNRPDAPGTDDRTRLFGSRAITASMAAFPGGAKNIDEIVALFNPYMAPDLRPQLHYTTGADTERVLVVRGTKITSKMFGHPIRKFQLAWVAPDPVSYGSKVLEAIAMPSISGAAGRIYDLHFDRFYANTGQTGSTPNLRNEGDLPAWPMVKIYGPITAPFLFMPYLNPFTPGKRVAFNNAFRIEAGEHVLVDYANRAAWLNSDPSQSVVNQINGETSVWTPIPVMPNYAQMSINGSSMAVNTTHAQINWREAFIT